MNRISRLAAGSAFGLVLGFGLVTALLPASASASSARGIYCNVVTGVCCETTTDGVTRCWGGYGGETGT